MFKDAKGKIVTEGSREDVVVVFKSRMTTNVGMCSETIDSTAA